MKMKKNNSFKKSLVASALVLCLCFTSFIGTTFAWFTDSATSGGNVITAGNLDVKLLMHDGSDYADISDSEGSIFGSDIIWEPGMTHIVYLAVENAGNLALKYNILVDILDSGLIGALEYAIIDDATKADADILALASWDDIVAVSGVQTGLVEGSRTVAASNGALAADEYDYFALAVHMQEEAGNEYMAKSIVVDVAVVATQLAFESDSYGTEYDKDAVFPSRSQAVKQANATLKLGETETGTSVAIPAGAPAGNYALTVSNKNVTTDENGNSTLAMDIALSRDGSKVESADGVLYTVKADIGKGLNITSVTHNGDIIGEFSYSALTGIIEFKTADFSPFAITYNEIAGLNPDAQYLAHATDIHNSTTLSGIFQLLNDVKTSEFGADSRYGYGYEYIVRKQADYTLDLNGKTIIHDTVNANANKNAFTYTLVANNAGTKLTINGEGTVVSHNSEGYTCAIQGKDGTLITVNGGNYEVHNGIAVWAGAGSHIVINGGSFINSDANTDHELIYSSGGVIDIYGGFFHNTDGNYTLNVEDRNRPTSAINVYGGTFVNFDPSTGGQDPNQIKVAEGYTVVSETKDNGDVWYTVVLATQTQAE